MFALTPEKVGCNKTRYSRMEQLSWPFLATDLLKREPPVLLLSLLEAPDSTGRVLFDWLNEASCSTSLGYFSEMMSCFGNDFHDKVSGVLSQMMEYLMEEREVLMVCLAASWHMEVFMVLFNCVIYSSEAYK